MSSLRALHGSALIRGHAGRGAGISTESNHVRPPPRAALDPADARSSPPSSSCRSASASASTRWCSRGCSARLQPASGRDGRRRLHLIEPRTETGGFPASRGSRSRDLRERLRAFRGLIALAHHRRFNVGEASRVERTFGQLVSGNYFTALGLRPALGRLLGPDDLARPAASRWWSSRTASGSRASARAPNAIGQTLRVNDRALTIVGVTPPRFQGTVLGLKFDLWVPATLAPVLIPGSRELEDRGVRGYR